MKRRLLSAGLAAVGLAVLFSATPARALRVAPQPGPQRLANADAVVVGKVVAIEPQDVKVQNTSFRVAVVKVDEAIRGVAKDVKTVRVGFIPPAQGNPGGPIIRPGIGRFNIQLQEGQAGLFMLTKHPTEKFYTVALDNFLPSTNGEAFTRDVKTIKKLCRVMDTAKESLKSKDAEERFMAAAALIAQYRTPRGPKVVQEPVDAAESKAVLLALADADWANAFTPSSPLMPTPVAVFYQLGVTPQDGWNPQNLNQQQIAGAMQTWLRDNAGKFRLKRFAAPSEK